MEVDINKLEELFDVEKFKEFLHEEAEREAQIEAVERRWMEKLNKLSFDERKALIEKVLDKYDSPAYKDRWFHHPKGPREPQEALLFFLLEYARVFGKEYEDEEHVFVSDKRIIDDYWVIKRYDGQGSFVSVRDKESEVSYVENVTQLERLYATTKN